MKAPKERYKAEATEGEEAKKGTETFELISCLLREVSNTEGEVRDEAILVRSIQAPKVSEEPCLRGMFRRAASARKDAIIPKRT